jgi:hypothetical protein
VAPHAPRPVGQARLSAPTSTTSTTIVSAARSPAAATTLAPAPAPGDGGESCPGAPGACAAGESTITRPWLALLAAAVLVGAPLAVVGAKRLRRWRRRHRRRPADRLAGAWRESAADLRGHRIPVPAAATGTELAAARPSEGAPGIERSLTRWARVLDTAVFAASEPDDDLADEAWKSQAELAAALRATTRPGRRLVIALDPRPLVEGRSDR